MRKVSYVCSSPEHCFLTCLIPHLIDVRLIKYAPAEQRRTPLYPKEMATITANMALNTDEQPFTHHAQGIISLEYLRKIPIPNGKGIPISMPKGVRRRTEKTSLKMRLFPRPK